MDLQLNGKTALVTGATAGIGLAIAKRLADEGAQVVICGRNQRKLDAAVAETGARSVLADPATAEGAKALVAALPDVDILVNKFGIYDQNPLSRSPTRTGDTSSTSMSSPAPASPAPISPA